MPDCDRLTGGGALERVRWKALIFAAISGLSAPPLPIPTFGGGRGPPRADWTLPRGVDEAVMPAVVALDIVG